MNRLLYGDNLSIMEKMPGRWADLIYLDPPFQSAQNYNLIYKTLTGKPVPEQAEAFCDTWEMDAEKEQLLKAMPALMRENGVEDYYVEFWRTWMNALRRTQPDLLAYLIYMVRRLIHMKVILKPTGSLYLHCDPTASHYIKVMLDGIFGHRNFRGELIWKRTSAHSGSKRWGPVHDVLLYYTSSDTYTWNQTYQPLPKETVDAWYNNVDPKSGRRFNRADLTGAGTRTGSSGEPWRGIDPTAKGRHWAIPRAEQVSDIVAGKETQEALDALDAAGYVHWPKTKGGTPMFRRFLDESKGVPAVDVITDIFPARNTASAKDRLGYPTQKPVELLKRIITASSNEGDVVFDPFCGCGTTIYAAEELGRKWVGCDIAILAVRLVQEQLGKRHQLVEGVHYEVGGIPNSVEAAADLWRHDHFQFEHWAVEKVGGFPTKKTGDKGIDGRIYFEAGQKLKLMVLSVKGGGVRPTDIRDLIGVLSTEAEATLAGFITLQPPSPAMVKAAAALGTWEHRGVAYPKVQILTVKDILEDGKTLQMPTRIKTKAATGQLSLPMTDGGA